MPLPFEVTVDDVSGLNSFEFPDLLNRLLRAETSRIGLLPTNVQTTLRVNDRDGGVDARVRDASSQSDWIPQGLSVWQFKSGADHGPADLRREFLKPRVQEALRQGGCYVIVVKEALNTDKQESREEALRECCSKAGIPSDRCRLLTAERIALWATQHPALCLLFRQAMVGS